MSESEERFTRKAWPATCSTIPPLSTGFHNLTNPPSSRPRPGSESEVPSTLGGTGEWLMYLITLDGVLPGPTRATEVLEAVKVAAEVRAHHAVAHGAERIL